MNIKEGDTVRIIFEDDSEYGKELRVHSVSGEHTVWVEVGVGMIWRYWDVEVELVTKNA